MAHKLERLLGSKINNVPALITEDQMREVVTYLETREAPHMGISKEDSDRKQMVMTDDLAMIPITGTLTYEPTFMGALCGMTSYQSLYSDVEKATKLGIKTFVFDANSGGGEAYAMMDTANSIREMVDGVGGKIITYVDGTCASACYGLAAISDEVISHPDARTGSIGVVVRLVNDNKAMKDKGYETTYITSAKSKVPFDTEGDFKQDFLNDIQSQVDDLHKRFASHVSEYREMSLEDVNSTEAKVYDSEKALSVGLIDKVMTHSEFYSYLETLGQGDNMPLNLFSNSKDKNLQTTQDETSMSVDTEVTQKLETALAENEALSATLQDAVALNEQLSADVETLKASLGEAQEQAKQAKLDDRKASLSEVLAEDEVDSVFNAISGLDDASFNAVLATYKTKASQEEEAPEFNEVGVSGESDANVEQLSGVMNLIKTSKKA